MTSSPFDAYDDSEGAVVWVPEASLDRGDAEIDAAWLRRHVVGAERTRLWLARRNLRENVRELLRVLRFAASDIYGAARNCVRSLIELREVARASAACGDPASTGA